MTTAIEPSAWLQGGARSTRAASTWPQIADLVRQEAAAPEPDEASPELASALQVTFDEADLARACASVAAEVRAAERAAQEALREERMVKALEAVAGGLDSAAGMLDERRRQFREAAAALAAAVAEALPLAAGPKLAARLAEALTSDCLARFDRDVALEIQVAPDIADPLAARLEASPVLRGRAARIAVEANPGLGPGEARLVWPDGHADWSIGRIRADAVKLIGRLADPRSADAGHPIPSKDEREARQAAARSLRPPTRPADRALFSTPDESSNG